MYRSMQEIGETVRKLRLAQGLTQEKLAKACHFSQGVITKLERGRTMPSVDNMMRIAEVLEVSVSVLLEKDVQEKEDIQVLMDILREKPASKVQEYLEIFKAIVDMKEN